MTLPDILLPRIHHFGLSIGRTSLRGVELDRTHHVSSAAEVILPESVFNEGVLTNQKVFIEGLKKLLAVGKFTTPYVAVCFSEAHAFSRELLLPKIEQDDIAEAVSWKVADLFPYPKADIYYDWKLLETQTDSLRVVVTSTQKKLLDPLIKALIASNLKPLSFEPGATVIMHLLDLKNDGKALLTEVNKKGAYVTMVVGEKAQFTSVINYTKEDTNESYLKNIETTMMEVVSYYRSKGVVGQEPFQIVLTGELAKEEIAGAIDKELRFPIRILRTQITNPAFNKAYAVASAPVAPPRDPYSINLLPLLMQLDYDWEQEKVLNNSLFTRTYIFLVLLIIFSLGIYLAITFRRQNIEQQVTSLRSNDKRQAVQTQNLLLLNSRARDIVALAPLKKTVRDKLEILAGLVPENIQVAQWDYDDGKQMVTLSGTALDRQALLDFKDKLEKSDTFTNVILPLGSLESPENIRFSITFVLK